MACMSFRGRQFTILIRTGLRWRLRLYVVAGVLPSGCYAGGPEPFRYLLYKDVNRHEAGFMTMAREIKTQPLTAARFAPFGDVLEFSGTPDMLINQGLCGRYHDRATLVHEDGRAGISLFDAQHELPYRLEMMERHPLGCRYYCR